mgnify:CR=1 FL=1
MSVMGKKVGQPPVEPGSSTAGSPSVHKIQGSVGIIFTGQGTVHAFNGFRCDLYRVYGAVGYRLETGMAGIQLPLRCPGIFPTGHG